MILPSLCLNDVTLPFQQQIALSPTSPINSFFLHKSTLLNTNYDIITLIVALSAQQIARNILIKFIYLYGKISHINHFL